MSGETWRMEDHVCLSCFGRVLSRRVDGAREYRCSNCGATATGHTPRVVCACGMKVGTRDAGIRCVVNDRRSVELPSEIIAREVG